jgi:hypothetical protein
MNSGTQAQSLTGLMEKCNLCKKKSYPMMFCKCSSVFCLKCRSPEDHKCTFDFKKEGKELLEKYNPKIQSEKLEKI